MLKTVNDSLNLLQRYNYKGDKAVMHAMEQKAINEKHLIYDILGGMEKQIKISVKNDGINIRENRALWDNYEVPLNTLIEDMGYHTCYNKLSQLYRLISYGIKSDWIVNNRIDITHFNCELYFAKENMIHQGININDNLLNSKLSKIIEKLCPHVLPHYNALRESVLKQRDLQYTLHLSINPYHFFKMSTDNHFTSCYNIQDGCYHGGITSYINDDVTIVSYMTKDDEQCEMTFRQLIHVDMDNKVVIIARPYPQLPNDGYLKALRKALRELFFSDSSDDDMSYVYTDSASKIQNRVSAPSSYCYVDVAKGSYEGVSMTYLKDFDVDSYYMRIARNGGTCIDCGGDYKYSESLTCCHRRDGIACEDCGELHDEDDMYYIDGHGYVCDSCVDGYSYCELCGERGNSYNNYREVNTRCGVQLWCESCHEDRATECSDCGELFGDRDFTMNRTHDGDIICNNCLDNYTPCEDCGDLHLTNDMLVHDCMLYCESCHEQLESED